VRQTEFAGGAGFLAGGAAGDGEAPGAAGLAGAVVEVPAETGGEVVVVAVDWEQAASAITTGRINPLMRES